MSTVASQAIPENNWLSPGWFKAAERTHVRDSAMLAVYSKRNIQIVEHLKSCRKAVKVLCHEHKWKNNNGQR